MKDLLQQCEQKELTAGDTNKIPDVDICLHFVALYMEDERSARYLWKRLGKEKKGVSEIKAIWELGKALLTNQHDKFFSLASKTAWGPTLQHHIERLVAQRRIKCSSLIAKAYSSVSLKDLARECGLASLEGAKTHALSMGWAVEGEYALPHEVQEEKKADETSIDQLAQLTEYVLHLEDKILQDIDVDYEKIEEEIKDDGKKKGGKGGSKK